MNICKFFNLKSMELILCNCYLNLTASIMISFSFLLSLTLSLISLIHSAFSLCYTFWDQTSLQNVLLSSAIGFHIILSTFSLNFFKQEFLVGNNLFCTNWLFLSSYFWMLVVLALILCFISSMTTLTPLFFIQYFLSKSAFALFFWQFASAPLHHTSSFYTLFWIVHSSYRIL